MSSPDNGRIVVDGVPLSAAEVRQHEELLSEFEEQQKRKERDGADERKRRKDRAAVRNADRNAIRNESSSETPIPRRSSEKRKSSRKPERPDSTRSSTTRASASTSFTRRSSNIGKPQFDRSYAISHRCYYLGQSWGQDFRAYMRHHHPFLTLYCPHHPLSWGVRCMSAGISVLVGLAATTGIYLWTSVADEDDAYWTLSFGEVAYPITLGTVFLATWLPALHAVWETYGWKWIVTGCPLQAGLLNFAIMSVWLVVSIALSGLLASTTSTDTTLVLISFGLELFATWMLWHPLISVILFSGILSCGQTSILGGRPYEMARWHKRTSLRPRPSSSKINSMESLAALEDYV